MVKFVFDSHDSVVAACEQLADDMVEFSFSIEKGDFILTVNSPIHYADSFEWISRESVNGPHVYADLFPGGENKEREPDPYDDLVDEPVNRMFYIDFDDNEDPEGV